MIPLTERQQRLLDAIRESMTTSGHPPTITELGNAVGLADPAVVRELRLIQLKGWVEPVGATKVRIHNPQETTPHGTA